MNGCPRSPPRCRTCRELEDVNSDQQDKGLEVDLKIDRVTAARLGLNAAQIDNALYDAFGQRQVSTIYKDKNQYHVVMEVAPAFWQSPETLHDIFVSTSGGAVSGTQSSAAAGGAFVIANTSTSTSTTAPSQGGTGLSASAADQQATAAQQASQDAVRNQQLNAVATGARGGSSTGASISTRVSTMVPLSAFASFGPGTTPLASITRAPFVATTFSFNLPAGEPMSTAVAAINSTMAEINVPISVHGEFAGTAQLFQKSLLQHAVPAAGGDPDHLHHPGRAV